MLRENLTQVYAEVATNSYNLWVQQLKEKEKILEKQLLEVNFLKEKIVFLFFLVFLFSFLLILINLYFYYRLRQNKSSKVLRKRKKHKILSSRNYSLKDFAQRTIKLTQKIPKDRNTELFLERLRILGRILIKNYKKIFPDDSLVKMEICKKNLKKIRYNLNKLLEKVENQTLKKEIRSLWNQNHKISVFLSEKIREKKKF